MRIRKDRLNSLLKNLGKVRKGESHQLGVGGSQPLIKWSVQLVSPLSAPSGHNYPL